MELQALLQTVRQWLMETPERALDQAYEAALNIKKIEDDYFQGNPISRDRGNYGESAHAFFQTEVTKNLALIKRRMSEFKASSTVFSVPSNSAMGTPMPDDYPPEGPVLTDNPTGLTTSEGAADDYGIDLIDKPAIIFKKLRFIDTILERYDTYPSRSDLTPVSNGIVDSAVIDRKLLDKLGAVSLVESPENSPKGNKPKREGLADRSSVVPRSILRTVDRVKQDLDPKSEADVIRNFRNSRGRTQIALRFVLLLIIVPLLTQQLAKNFIVGPIIDQLRSATHAEVFLNESLENEALHELQQYEEKLQFEVLIGKIPNLSKLGIEEKVHSKALELEEVYRDRSATAIKNVFSDILAVFAFSVLIRACKRQIAILKSFMDEIIYGLSDSAKAFIIILFTDTFVGFHSPHGWEVMLSGLSRHLGLPENHDFIFLFIATFPVILDTVFKYWIFRYLNRISPSAVATYKNMNE